MYLLFVYSHHVSIIIFGPPSIEMSSISIIFFHFFFIKKCFSVSLCQTLSDYLTRNRRNRIVCMCLIVSEYIPRLIIFRVSVCPLLCSGHIASISNILSVRLYLIVSKYFTRINIILNVRLSLTVSGYIARINIFCSFVSGNNARINSIVSGCVR